MQGNEACAQGALAAGCRFFAGYPITPSSEIAEELAKLLPRVGGKFIQMEDEIGAMAACIGASLGGLKVLTATSGPGFSLKQENLGFAAYAEIPCVLVNVMRGGPSTGLPTSPGQGDVMQARWGTHGDHPIIALAPASVREVYELTLRAFDLAERYRTPVILLYDEIIGHMREKTVLPDPSTSRVRERKRPTVPPEAYLPFGDAEDDVPPLASFGEGYRYHVTGLAHDERGFPTQDPRMVERLQRRLTRKIERHREDIVAFETTLLDDAEVAVLAYGVTARSARAAVRMARAEGVRAGLFRPITLWPFPDAEVGKLAERVGVIVVAEMNLGQIAREVERASRGRADVVGCFKVSGEPIAPQEILRTLRAGALGRRGALPVPGGGIASTRARLEV
ncbi:MAG TPA: 2-oxoacid:acceptor oxidoreductase subunit alpha [Candidatus Methylomirabilis sp.]|jgi:2-oxoglutarate ferredoxin oxidoreductase subunit alpha|nr:2-oxoacid:acceptor oxidoreductase subunit alpha [Candidatus Methylomirabilis sp.]